MYIPTIPPPGTPVTHPPPRTVSYTQPAVLPNSRTNYGRVHSQRPSWPPGQEARPSGFREGS